MIGSLFYWVADWNLTRSQAELLLHDPTGLMIDCTRGDLERALVALRAHNGPRRVAGYVTGTPDIRWTAEEFKQVPTDCAVLRIDQSNGDLPLLADVRSVKDVEFGASTEHTAITVARERLHAGRNEIVYIDHADVHDFEDLASQAGLPAGKIIAYQYASPTSNPHAVLPGTPYTLAEANCDLSVILQSHLPLPGLRTAENGSKAPPAGHDRQYDDGFAIGYKRGFDAGELVERHRQQHD